MAKTTFTAHLPDGTTATRKSETMTYTHAVVIFTQPTGWRPDPAAGEGCGTWGPMPDQPRAWKVFHWCGRADLAQKQANRYNGRLSPDEKIQIVEVTS